MSADWVSVKVTVGLIVSVSVSESVHVTACVFEYQWGCA